MEPSPRMQLHQLKPTNRKTKKRVGRGGKRGTTSGHGTKGQKGRAGASVRPGFRGGDKPIWAMFPKSRGASRRHGSGNPRIHHKHRFFSLKHTKPEVLNISEFNRFDGVITPEILLKEGVVFSIKKGVKILGGGELTKKIEFQGFLFSESAKEKALKAGATIK